MYFIKRKITLQLRNRFVHFILENVSIGNIVTFFDELKLTIEVGSVYELDTDDDEGLCTIVLFTKDNSGSRDSVIRKVRKDKLHRLSPTKFDLLQNVIYHEDITQNNMEEFVEELDTSGRVFAASTGVEFMEAENIEKVNFQSSIGCIYPTQILSELIFSGPCVLS